ncbi:hypothetical protein Tco_1440726 [Tanacetum coccineum]
MKQQGDDVASWSPRNVLWRYCVASKDIHGCARVRPTSVSVKWLPFTNRNSDEAQTSEHGLDELRDFKVWHWVFVPCVKVVVVSSDWSLVSAVLGQMTYPVASLTPDSARSYVMQGAPFTQGTIPSIPIGGNISPEGFLSSIMLLVVIICLRVSYVAVSLVSFFVIANVGVSLMLLCFIG